MNKMNNCLSDIFTAFIEIGSKNFIVFYCIKLSYCFLVIYCVSIFFHKHLQNYNVLSKSHI